MKYCKIKHGFSSRSLTMFMGKYAVWLISLFMMNINAVAYAENLVSAIPQSIAPLLGEDNISNIMVINDRAIAFGDTGIWILGENDWQKALGFKKTGNIKAVVNDGGRGFLLLSDKEDGPLKRIEGFSLPPLEEQAAISSSSTLSEIVSLPKLPELPVSLSSAHGSILDDKLYIAGVSIYGVPQFLSVDLQNPQANWVVHDAWLISSALVTSVVAQDSSIFVTLAENPGNEASDQGSRMLKWTVSDGWTELPSLSGSVIAGSARKIGQGHVLYMVNDGDMGHRTPKIMSFYALTGSWVNYGNIDAEKAMFSAPYKNGFIWGQSGKGGTGAEFSSVGIETGKQLLHAVDWGVIIVYLMGMLGIGLYFYTQHAQDSQSDFFLGGRSIPFWAAGISLYASNASSISYIAVPAKAFATNWNYLMSNLIVIIGLIIVAIWIVPMLRRLNLMSIFQYLESRFHPSIRLLSSALFMVFQLGGRMTVILFLPSMAIATVTGFDVTWSIIIMGGITIIYTVLGGMKAVIWTDVIQLFVMFGGTFFAITFVFMMLDGGVSEFLTVALEDNKMDLINWNFDLTEATIWGFIFLVIFDTVLTFPKDQVLMQRVLSTSTAKEAGKSVWTFAAIVLPASVIFYLVGTALYVFYKSHPERMDPSLSIDATFPLFIAAELPLGVTGLIIAGIFAASMSTLSSILNCVATTATVDFYSKINKNASEKKTIRFAEIVTVVSGMIGISLALLLTRFEIKSLLDLALELWGLLGGGFAGAYTLGMFTRRSNWQGVAIGVAVSIAITLVAWLNNMVHPYFYLPLSICICIIVGYTASLLFPAPSRLDGLTIFKEDTVE